MFTNPLDTRLEKVKAQNKKALIAYLAAGYPVFKQSEKIICALEEAGVDVLELGVPFSDPIADGPTIQLASQKALENKVTLRKILVWVKHLTKKTSMPIVLMSYLNPIIRMGLDRFARDAFRAGVTGLIVPDLIPEESVDVREILNRHKIHLIHLLSPTTPKSRQKEIAKLTTGFLYAVSVAGVTGARKSFTPKTKAWLNSLRGLTRGPVCVGFGIAGTEQIHGLKKNVDGFIVGSALIDRIRLSPSTDQVKSVKTFMSALSKECSDAQ